MCQVMCRVCVVVALLWVVGCDPIDPPFEQTTGDLSGCLLLEDGNAAAGAMVWIKDQFDTTAIEVDAQGRFSMAQLPVGEVELVGLVEGSLGWSVQADIVGGRTTALSCEPMAPTGCIGGSIQYNEGKSQPVEIMVADTPLWAWSRADGTFEVQAPAKQCYEVTFRGVNLQDRTETICAGESGAQCEPERSIVSMVPADEPEAFVWKRLPDMLVPIADPAAALDGTTLYVGAGHSCPDGSPCDGQPSAPGQTKAFQFFSFEQATWTRGPDLKVARSVPSAAMLGGKFYVISGRARNAAGNLFPKIEVEFFDPETKQWHDGPSLNLTRSWATAVSSNRAIHVIGGFGSDYYDTIEVLALGADEWTQHPAEFAIGAYQHLSCMSGQRIFTFGGLKYPARRDIPSGIPEDHLSRLCAHRLLSFDSDAIDWSIGPEPAPIHRESGDCVVLGEYLYAPGYFVGPGSHEDSLLYDIRNKTWQVQPVGPSTSRYKVIATPHGFISLGGGGSYNDSLPEMFMAVAERFEERAEALYTTDTPVELPQVDPEEHVMLPDNLDELCAELE